VFQVDAFTQTPFTGNPAGVVLGGDELSDAEMQAIARELNNGDTAFALQPDRSDHDLRVRFFTPRAEASFVGHATVALHAVRAHLGLAPARRQQQRSGMVHIDVDSVNTGDTSHIRVRIHQPPPRLREPLNGETLRTVLAALSLDTGMLDPRLPPTLAGEASTRALIAVRASSQLAMLRPDLTTLAVLSPQVGAQGFLVYTLDSAVPHCLTEARMFCPAIGINEDPVSGNAHGMLAALLHRHGLLSMPHFIAAQGHHVGRPGRIELSVQPSATPGEVAAVTIGGGAAIVFEAQIYL
jgi:PhzF family phenazine biosynthesis protein